jgi:uncharacterized hydrophobic protein (TIGR00271 family)
VIHLRLVIPEDRTKRVEEMLCSDEAVYNVIVLPGAARHPVGDVILADVAREDTSALIADLRELRIDQDGSIALEHVDTAISPGADHAVKAAKGEEADAVVWEEVEARTSEEAALSGSYLAFMCLAAVIAAAGLMLDSPILVVGAMVVGPEFGPLAGLCVALVNGRAALARRSLLALAVGFPAAILFAFAVSAAIRALGLEPDDFSTDEGLAETISNPDVFALIVAFSAGVAGMLSLTTAKSGALIGVLISVTTIPAAADVGVSAAFGDWEAVAGSAAQLAVNLTSIVLAGVLTLRVQRESFRRRRKRRERQKAAA